MVAMAVKRACENCLFYAIQEQSNGEAPRNGNCRRSPPTVFMVIVPEEQTGQVLGAGGVRRVAAQAQFPAAWPLTMPDHWCGEFKLAQKTKPFPIPAAPVVGGVKAHG